METFIHYDREKFNNIGSGASYLTFFFVAGGAEAK